MRFQNAHFSHSLITRPKWAHTHTGVFCSGNDSWETKEGLSIPVMQEPLKVTKCLHTGGTELGVGEVGGRNPSYLPSSKNMQKSDTQKINAVPCWVLLSDGSGKGYSRSFQRKHNLEQQIQRVTHCIPLLQQNKSVWQSKIMKTWITVSATSWKKITW